ncbi:hypothetical protein D9611_010101 [Ephemerocybe angulata]|uniref:Uncharacterized protein n=1 Tax=Ephemerocybe angulata TaxID=980116 RepID=A0A8H5AZV7_9AGAR|nr:hypothetical protein D9611_010101 [Tulosesus angulatus]
MMTTRRRRRLARTRAFVFDHDYTPDRQQPTRDDMEIYFGLITLDFDVAEGVHKLEFIECALPRGERLHHRVDLASRLLECPARFGRRDRRIRQHTTAFKISDDSGRASSRTTCGLMAVGRLGMFRRNAGCCWVSCCAVNAVGCVWDTGLVGPGTLERCVLRCASGACRNMYDVRAIKSGDIGLHSGLRGAFRTQRGVMVFAD